MEKVQSINPARIVWCCADFGISPGQLAAELDISPTSIERVLAGEAGITFIQLRKIADYFGRGVMFFLESGPIEEVNVHSPQFRTLANQKPELSTSLKKFIERVEQQRAVYLSLREDLDETAQRPFKPPQLDHIAPSEAASSARAWLGLGEVNNFNSYRKAVEAQGILVFRSNGYGGKWQMPKQNPILGFTLYDAVCPVIVVKKQNWDTQQTFTLMHELGHLLLHKTSSIDDEHDLLSHQGHEREANAFAGYLLAPDEFLANIRDTGRPDDITQYDAWLEPQRHAWGISTEVILRRLMDVHRLPQSRYTAYRQWRNHIAIPHSDVIPRTYRYREPMHLFGDQYVRTVLDALNARHITLAKASTYLDSLKITDLHQLEKFYAGL